MGGSFHGKMLVHQRVAGKMIDRQEIAKLSYPREVTWVTWVTWSNFQAVPLDFRCLTCHLTTPREPTDPQTLDGFRLASPIHMLDIRLAEVFGGVFFGLQKEKLPPKKY